MSHSSAPERENGAVITDWRPEDPAFWQQRGHRVASRNLWISVPCLLLAFCVWMLFSAVAVNLPKVGFTFTTDQLFMLTALPALSGALLRVPYAFMVPLFGGRRWTAFSTGSCSLSDAFDADRSFIKNQAARVKTTRNGTQIQAAFCR